MHIFKVYESNLDLVTLQIKLASNHYKNKCSLLARAVLPQPEGAFYNKQNL